MIARLLLLSFLIASAYKLPAQQATVWNAPHPQILTGWTLVGPQQVFDANNQPRSIQSDVRCISASVSTPGTLYAGTEPGEVYRTTDNGLTWNAVGTNYDFQYGGIESIAVDPTDANTVYCGTNTIRKSTDGGTTWTPIFTVNGLNTHEILVNPSNPQVIMLAGDSGLFRSVNGGANWSRLYTEKCFDVKLHAANNNRLFLVKDNPVLKICEFYSSADMGATWTLQSSGWYFSGDPLRTDLGARIAISANDTNRIYAYLIGTSKINDNGFIGLYRSDDGGVSWYLPNGPDGSPYSAGHPNLATSGTTFGSHNGFYNCALMASGSNANDLLIGGINLWRSQDGGYTFTPIGGNFTTVVTHTGMQDFRATSNGYWITTDGGIHYSNDFFNSQNLVRIAGVHSLESLGFGSGWNDDVLITGSNHEANLAWTPAYGPGNFLSLGGTNVATGYIDVYNAFRFYTSDLGINDLPGLIGAPTNLGFWGLQPNENSTPASSSELEFLPSCYNTAFLGFSNAIWVTYDRGVTFSVLHVFGNNPNALAGYIEISRSNEKVMYVTQQPATGNQGFLWKTTDGGLNWSAITIPAGNSSRLLITMSATDENTLWLAYPSGANGNKIFKTTDGGTNWTNLTTSALDNQEVHFIQHIGGTDGGVYYGTDKSIYYHNNSILGWALYNMNLPSFLNTNTCRPFYKDGKIRISSYGKGIWENYYYEPQTQPVAQITVDYDSLYVTCGTDSFHFADYSMLNQNGASRAWTFQNAAPITAAVEKPVVAFNGAGTFLITLTVTDAAAHSDIDSLYVTVTSPGVPATVSEGFEQPTFPPPNWTLYDQLGDATWSLSTATGGFGSSAQSALFDNYGVSSGGTVDDMRFRADLGNAVSTMLTFDVAYARYDAVSLDTMEVLVSTDCGATFTIAYLKSSTVLATAPDDGNFFVPTATQWRNDSIDLTPYAGQQNLLVVFRNIGRYGNCLYVDNINLVSDGVGLAELQPVKSDVNLFPNPAEAGGKIQLVSDHAEKFELVLFDSNGKRVMDENVNTGASITLPAILSPGNYYYMLTGTTLLKRGKLLVVGGRK